MEEEIINTRPEDLTSKACRIFDANPGLKKAYEEKWETDIDCVDQ